jgi:outer membrane protein TolC
VAEAEAKQARLLPNPILNIDVRFPQGAGKPVVEPTLTEDLIAVLQLPRRTSAADKRLRAAAADAMTDVLNLITEVEEAYAAVQSGDAEVANIEQRAGIIQKLRDVAEARRAAGDGSLLDVLTLDAQRVALAEELYTRRLERTQDRLTLARLIGEPLGAADWKIDQWRALPPLDGSETAWLETALTNRPEINALAWELAAAGDDIKLTTLLPLEGGEVGVHGERDSGWRVGPTITTPLPIFDFGQAARAKAKAERDAKRYELAQQRLEVIEDVRKAYATYMVSRAALDQTRNELVPLLEKQRQQAELAYKAGEADLTTLLTAETGLQEAMEKLTEWREKVTVARVRLQRAAGGAGVAKTIPAGPTTMPSLPITPSAATQPANNTGSSR